jgi:NAD(P)-dependent dehydrogenase (short-subunit alcohol dehydrogenase family)
MILDRFGLNGRVALVTGAARGIGQATARALCEAGAEVILSDVDSEAARDAAAELGREGLRATAMVMDVADPSAVEAAADEVVRAHGRLDILVNNAGVGALGAALETSDDEWRRIIDVNTNAVFWCARAFGRHMVARRSGSIVNIGSMSGLIINRGFAAAHYMVSKAGVHQITKALAVEWAEAGVRVNAVAPGYTATSQTELLRSRPDLRDVCLSTTPMGRFADPVEIASAVLFLASDAASYCTGTILTVDGGHTCW